MNLNEINQNIEPNLENFYGFFFFYLFIFSHSISCDFTMGVFTKLIAKILIDKYAPHNGV